MTLNARFVLLEQSKRKESVTLIGSSLSENLHVINGPVLFFFKRSSQSYKNFVTGMLKIFQQTDHTEAKHCKLYLSHRLQVSVGY